MEQKKSEKSVAEPFDPSNRCDGCDGYGVIFLRGTLARSHNMRAHTEHSRAHRGPIFSNTLDLSRARVSSLSLSLSVLLSLKHSPP